MSNISDRNRDLVRSAVVDVENFLQSHSADEDTMNSLKLIKHTIVALDNLRLKYDIHSTKIHETQSQIQSDVSSGITHDADLNKNWSFTFKDFAETLAHNLFFSRCCDKAKLLPLDTEYTDDSCENDTSSLSNTQTTGSNRNTLHDKRLQSNKHFIGNSRRTTVLRDECVEEYMKQLGSNWHLDLLALANLPSVISEGPVISIGRRLLSPIGEAINPDFNDLVLPVLRDIQDVYVPNPYHNALHGAMVSLAF